MQIDDLRDTLAIEITRILLTISAAKDFSDIEKILSRAYPLTDAVLAKRNVSRPVITKREHLPSRNPERGGWSSADAVGTAECKATVSTRNG
jgi:hypothetical protein